MRRLFFILVFLFSCSDELTNTNTMSSIENLIVDINRQDNELYIQLESASFLNSDTIDSATVNLEYSGLGDLEFNQTFLLYDNGEHGDIIPGNGIYTLLDSADKIDSPNNQSEIVSIDFPLSFELDSDQSDILFSVTIQGKQYLATASLYQSGDVYILDEYINIDNTQLEIQINKSKLYIDDDDSDQLCNRVYNKYEDIFYPITFDWPDAQPIIFSDNFIYESGFTINSMQDCASTGEAVFRFTLNDLDTGSSTYLDRSIILYGCGDGVCEENYESINTCFEDCSNE